MEELFPLFPERSLTGIGEHRGFGWIHASDKNIIASTARHISSLSDFMEMAIENEHMIAEVLSFQIDHCT